MRKQFVVLTLLLLLSNTLSKSQTKLPCSKHPQTKKVPPPLYSVIKSSNKSRVAAHIPNSPPMRGREDNNDLDMDSLEANLNESIACLRDELRNDRSDEFDLQSGQNLCNLNIFDVSGGKGKEGQTKQQSTLLGADENGCQQVNVCKVVRLPRLGKKRLCLTQSVCD